MGKNLTQQARGKGGPSFTSPGFRYLGEARLKHGVNAAEILDIVKDQGKRQKEKVRSRHKQYKGVKVLNPIARCQDYCPPDVA